VQRGRIDERLESGEFDRGQAHRQVNIPWNARTGVRRQSTVPNGKRRRNALRRRNLLEEGAASS
jgi:hypothetical protein